MIFPDLKVESILQVNDKTRLDASGSFSNDELLPITVLEIEPDAGLGFVSVLGNGTLDYAYDSSGDKTVTVNVDDGNGPKSITKTITVILEVDDALFSDDTDIQQLEDDILNYVRLGRTSFLDKHREAQSEILRILDDRRIWRADGSPLQKTDIWNVSEVRDWSKYTTLRIIFNSLSNAVDDIFSIKAESYEAKAAKASNRAALRLDTDGDGSVDETRDLQSLGMVRR